MRIFGEEIEILRIFTFRKKFRIIITCNLRDLKMAFKLKPPVTVVIVCLFELLGIILIPSALFKETTQEIGL
jgi:hypothetical protein